MTATMSEYGKRCGLCHKARRSRIFYRQVNSQWLRLCADCWEQEDAKDRRAGAGAPEEGTDGR